MNKTFHIDMGDYLDVVVDGIEKNGSFELAGCGKSMYPFIKEESDTVILEKNECDRVRVGEIYLYKRPMGGYAIHRVYAVLEDTVWMLGDAQFFVEKNVKKSELIAIASKIKKPKQTVDCTTRYSLAFGFLRARLRMFFFRVRKFIFYGMSRIKSIIMRKNTEK